MTSRNFMFSWQCISIYLCKGKPTWCTICREHILSNTSTCFGRIHCPSSRGRPYVYNNWYLLSF